MRNLLIALPALVLATVAAYAQGSIGQVVFANRVGTTLDAPVTVMGSNPTIGPGPAASAQLYLANADGSVGAPLTPISTFRPAGTGAAVIADRYWLPQTVDVTGHAPGDSVTFIVRAWQTSAGSYDASGATRGQSAPFTVQIGGGTLPPANLVTLQAFTYGILPEPPFIVLGVLGVSIFALVRRK
jgi:hypothetical protein